MLKAFVALVLIFTVNIPSMYYGWYLKWSWFDITLHFLGGFFMAMFLWNYFRRFSGNNPWANLFFVVGLTSIAGILWEFAEYLANQTLVDPIYERYRIRAYFIGDLHDTLLDLFMDMSGGIVYYALHLLWGRYTHQG